jgi:DNA-binding NarL/FixJ family response regulator
MGTQAFDAGYAAGLTFDLAQVAAALGSTDTAAVQARVAVSGEAVTVLRPRELGVLELVARGLSNPDVARRLS